MRVALQPADTKIQAWFAKSVVVILGGWIDRYSRVEEAPHATTGEHIAGRISDYYRQLGHASVITLDDLRRYDLNVDHMNNSPELQEFCMTACNAAQVGFILTNTVKSCGAVSTNRADRSSSLRCSATRTDDTDGTGQAYRRGIGGRTHARG